MTAKPHSLKRDLTDAELLVLGLVVEMPRHGYELEHVIEQRGMREWTQIGFSSIYFVLGKLEKAKLIVAKVPAGAKAKKIYSASASGHDALHEQTLKVLRDVRPTYSSVLLGMAHWPAMRRDEALDALQARHSTLEKEHRRLEGVLSVQQPLPDFVEALFDNTISQLQAELEWVERTLHRMTSKTKSSNKRKNDGKD
ncbi:MAG: PadR family transcriptional regulator [Rhizobiaceae bacterium]